MFGLGFQELMIVGVVAVLLFGKRLPEVAKSLGASYREFRQGLNEIQSQFDLTGNSYSSPKPYRSAAATTRKEKEKEDTDDYDQPTAPKFELPAPAETAETASQSSESPTG